MNLSEYIQKLLALQQEHGGDLEVVDASDEKVGEPEYSADPGQPVIVICDQA